MNTPDPIEEALSFAKYIPSTPSAHRSTADEHVITLAAEVRRLREVEKVLRAANGMPPLPELNAPKCKRCGDPCQKYGGVGGFSVQCKKCNERSGVIRRAASAKRRSELNH